MKSSPVQYVPKSGCDLFEILESNPGIYDLLSGFKIIMNFRYSPF